MYANTLDFAPEIFFRDSIARSRSIIDRIIYAKTRSQPDKFRLPTVHSYFAGPIVLVTFAP
jgi:hypothetical protein